MKRVLFTLFSLAFLTPAFAASVKDLKYDINYYLWHSTITITGCNRDASGELIIPTTIDGIKVTEIGSSAFEGCSSLTSVTIPEGVTKIGDEAFRGCSSLKIVVDEKNLNFASQNGALFNKEMTTLIRGPGGTTSYTIPEGVTKIGGGAFAGCSSLKIVVDEKNLNFASQNGALFNKEMTTLIRGPGGTTSYTIPEGVTEIGSSAFEGCSSLTSVTIPEGVTKIGGEAFQYCSSLTSVKIPSSVTSIGDWAFSYCSSLTSVIIPSSVTEIGELAFSNCTSLTSVTILEGVTSIGEGAFADCSRLTSVTIPEGVTEIEEAAFGGCSNLTSVTISKGVTKIGEGAFSGCTAMKEMIFNGPPPNVEPLNEGFKQYLERNGLSNPETLPATKGYYHPEYAKDWEAVLGGETGEWNNLQMQPITEEMLAQLKAAEAQEDTVNPSKGITQSASSSILWFIFGLFVGVIIVAAVTVFILKKKKAA